MSEAQSVGWENSLGHGARRNWVRDNISVWFAEGGILHPYQVTLELQLLRQISSADSHGKGLFDRRGHQMDQTGDRTEGDNPLFVQKLFDIFD